MTPKEHKQEHKVTHCKHGHEFTPENTYINQNKRLCRKCRYLNHAQWQTNNYERYMQLHREHRMRKKLAL